MTEHRICFVQLLDPSRYGLHIEAKFFGQFGLRYFFLSFVSIFFLLIFCFVWPERPDDRLRSALSRALRKTAP